MKREYKMHARNTEDTLYAMLHELVEGIDSMDSDCVISSCEKLIEELNTIKELYTDESLL